MDEGSVDTRAGALDGRELHAAGAKKSLKRVGARGDEPAFDPGDGRLGNARLLGKPSLREPGSATPRSHDRGRLHIDNDIKSVSDD